MIENINKSSVSTSDIFSFTIRDFISNPIFFLVLLFPIFFLMGLAYTFTDIIIVYSDFQNFEKNYQLRDFLIGLAYVLIESYVLGVIAIIVHNKIIKRKFIFNIFSKELFIYGLFYLIPVHYLFLVEVALQLSYFGNIGGILFIIILFLLIISVFTFMLTCWFWILYLPNIAVKDNYTFMYIFKNSKGARLTIFLQTFYFLILYIPFLILYYFIGEHLAGLIMAPIIVIFFIAMLSNTYLEWKLLEKNRN